MGRNPGVRYVKIKTRGSFGHGDASRVSFLLLSFPGVCVPPREHAGGKAAGRKATRCKSWPGHHTGSSTTRTE
nr:MAG TPA: hypothetical protein [Phage sp. ctucZ11]